MGYPEDTALGIECQQTPNIKPPKQGDKHLGFYISVDLTSYDCGLLLFLLEQFVEKKDCTIGSLIDRLEKAQGTLNSYIEEN